MVAHRDPVGGPSRRQLLAAAALVGASALLPRGAAAQAPPKPYRIDTHCHFFPPAYLEPLAEWGRRGGFGGLQPPQRDWTIAKALDVMDASAIATGVLSISTPGVWFGEREQARKVARLCNDFGAQMIRDHRGRFGLFAAMPMPDVEGTLHEIEYALDTLKADGIGLMTSYGDRWPGDPAFEPVMQELNRRKAVVYTHPTVANCCRNLIPGLPPPVIEFGTDTTRAIAQLVFGGTAARFPDIKFIFSHAGGTMPFLIERF